MNTNNERKIRFFTTGGTIGSTKGDQGESVVDRAVTEAFSKDILQSCENIKKNWGITITIEEYPLLKYVDAENGKEISGKDSTNIDPEDWQEIISAIENDYDKFDGFLVTHGTNTMGYTSAAVSLALCNLTKPVVFTGSQVPYAIPGSDAMMNLENALRMVAYPPTKDSPDGHVSDVHYEEDGLMGVFAVIGSHIITGCRVKKVNDYDYDAFKTFNFKTGLGRIGRYVRINKEGLDFHNKFFGKPQYDITGDDADKRDGNGLDVRSGFNTHQIASFTEFPGMRWELFKDTVENSGVQGIVFRAYGAGDPNENLFEGFRWLKKNRIPIVMTTQAPDGMSTMSVNDPGKKLFKAEDNDVIPAWDMSTETMTTKLGWLLANETDSDPDVRYRKIVQKMNMTLRGEKDELPPDVREHLFRKI